MTRIDQFESVFRAATKAVFRYTTLDVQSALVVTDLDAYESQLYCNRVRSFLPVLEQHSSVQWDDLPGKAFHSVERLLHHIETDRPDLIITYRNLHSEAWKWGFSLGEYLDVLTQVTETPILVLPHPSGPTPLEHALQNTNIVMAITDRLTGDDELVNWALCFTEPKGILYLTHIEDQATFDHYLDIIGKIASIDTDPAREEIAARLVQEPLDYIETCKTSVQSAGLDIEIRPIVRLGHRLALYKDLVRKHKVDILVFNTKDEDQLAMHGLAYPLAIELREIPLLMI